MIEDVVLESEMNVLLEMSNCYCKQLFMEEVTDTRLDDNIDSVSKLNQFINWVKRCVKTILAKINRWRLNKRSEEMRLKDFSGRVYNMDASMVRTLNNLCSTSGRMNKDPYGFDNNFGKLVFDKKYGKQYQNRADYLQDHQFKPIETQRVKKQLDSDSVKRYVDATRETGMKIADRLVSINDHIDQTKKILNDEDRKSEAFQQYVRMLTFELSNDLKVVQFINKFYDTIKLFSKKEKSVDDSTDVDSSNSSDQSKDSSGDEPDNDDSSEFPPDVKHEINQSVIKSLCTKFVFNKHPKCDAIYCTLLPDNDTILCQYNLNEGKEGDIHQHKFSINKYAHKAPWNLILKVIPMDKAKKQLKDGCVIKR